MHRRSWVLGLAVAASLVVWTATGRADDTMKLDLKAKDAVKTTNLLGDGGADTVETRWGWGGWRGGWGGARWGWGGWGWGGPRWGWGGPRWGWTAARWGWGGPGWGWAWNWGRPWVGVTVAGPRFVSAPVIVSQPVVVTDPCAPISLNVPSASLSIPRRPADARLETIPAPRRSRPAQPDGTFQYDGGPTSPVPMPQAGPEPSRTSPRTIVPEGRVVSLPAKTPKYSYAAYGEKPQSRSADVRQVAAKTAK